jgi:hypothetical protein
VDPNTTEIAITFDRPMRDRSWSFVGGGEHYPETTGEPFYNETRTTITLPVKLKPDWDYEFWLNRAQFTSFRSQDGTSLQPFHMTFRTGTRSP